MSGDTTRIAPEPPRLFGTDSVRGYLRKAEFRTLYKSELDWAFCHLNIIDICADFAYREVEDLRSQLTELRAQITAAGAA